MAQAESRLCDWVVRACPDGLWVWDEAGRTIFANERMAEMLGIEHASIVGFSAFDAMDDAGREDLRRHLDQLRETGNAANDLDCRFERPDGTHVWALVSHTPLLDDDGVSRGWLHRASEHSLQHQRLVELERREKLFVQAQLIARIASWEWQVAATEVAWSEEMFEVYGMDPEVFTPSVEDLFARIHPDDTHQVRRVLVDALATHETHEPFTFDYRFVSDGGEVRCLRSRAVVGRDEAGRAVRITGTSQDVTESKENEDALGFLSAMGAAANDASTLEDVLVAAEAIIKPHAQWPVLVISAPKHPGGDELVHLDIDWVPASEELREAARGLAVRVAAERRIVEVVGPTGTVLVAGAVEVDGRLGCVLVTDTRSVTFGRPADLAIFGQMIAMLASVAEREWAAEELAAARDQALEASKAKSEFLATMSHEIRTPLNGVIGLSELLGSTELTPHQRRLTAGVDQAGRTLLALINDILDLSKIEAGRLDLEEVDFDPRTIIEQSAALVADQARTKQLELIVSSAEDVPEQVRGDPVRFGQVITNLAANAVKFTATGEVSIRATGGHGPDGSGVRVAVSDTGVGVSDEAKERLFRPFTQADSSTTRQYGGTGLGLAISKRIVSAMDGDIGVESEPGRGSTFWFTATFGAPLYDVLDREAEREGAVAGLRVLVVDDNETNRFILTEKLTAWNVVNKAAVSAYEALVELDAAHHRDSPYDIVLLDYMMPGADGEQLAKIIRAESRHDSTRLVLLSSAMEPSERFLEEAGIDTFLSKPVLRTQLLETLGSLSGRAEPDADPGDDARAPDATGRPHLGRVLVVEDNPVNQLVAEGVLRGIGYETALADNGAAGLAAFAAEEGSFDAILMDCQMPVMNGYDATRAIRAMHSVGVRIPIIAMTAAAVAGEEQRCLDAGMDDFLLKPVDRALLEATLRRWIPGPSKDDADVLAGQEQRASRPPAAQRPARVLDRQRLADLIEDDAADVPLVLRIITSFTTRARAGTEELAAAVRAGETPAVVALAHTLRGSAGNVGLPRLADLLAHIEHRAAAGQLVSTEMLDAVRLEQEAGIVELEHLAADLAREAASP